MAEDQDAELIAALQRLASGQAGGDDLPRLQQAIARGRISVAPAQPGVNQLVSQSGGVNLGQSNQVQISGSAIGSMTLSLPGALEAIRLLDLL
jgi:hypothetical protein